MSHQTDWRCQCGRELGTLARVGLLWRLTVKRSVDDVLLAPGSAGVICPACGQANIFEPHGEMAGTVAP